MSLQFTNEDKAILAGEKGMGAKMALRIVAETARLMGAPRLLPITSAHIDGALYHGDLGTLFAEKLVEGEAKVAVRSTLNVGALDLMGCSKQRLPPHERDMAKRMMRAYEKMGCEPSWTCSPYQAGHRPALGSDVAWGESNAVVSAIPFLARAQIAMVIFWISPARLRDARRITVCIERKIVARDLLLMFRVCQKRCVARIYFILCLAHGSALR